MKISDLFINYIIENNLCKNRVKHNIVYNLVLEDDSNHIVLVNGIYSICMAHNYSDNIVLKHNFFGNYDLVCSELEKCDVDDHGIKIVTHFTRDEFNNINGLTNLSNHII